MAIVKLLPEEFTLLEFYINQHGQVVDFVEHPYIDHETIDLHVRVTDMDFDQVIRKLPYQWELELTSIELKNHGTGTDVKFQIKRHLEGAAMSQQQPAAIYF